MDRMKWLAITGLLTLALAANGCAQSTPRQASPVKQPHDAASATPTFELGSRKYWECVATAGDDSQAQGRCLDGELAYQQEALDRLYQEWVATLDTAQRDATHTEQRAWQLETNRLCGPAVKALPVDQACRLERIVERYDVLGFRLAVTTGAHRAADAPNADGALEIRLGNAVITLQSDGCSDRLPSKLICSNARLSVSTPALHRQALFLPEVWLPRASPTDRYPTEIGFRGSLQAGFAQSRYGIMLSDINMDGHEDLMVWSGSDGNYGDPSYTYYLYDPKTQRLVENTALAELMEGHSLSRIVDGRLFAWCRSGPCERGEKTIEVRDGVPRIVERTDYSTCGKDGLELDAIPHAARQARAKSER